MSNGNLVDLRNRTPEERREIAKKGAKASAEVRRSRKTLREELKTLLAEGDTQERMSLAIIQKALDGDVKSFRAIAEVIGELKVKPETVWDFPLFSYSSMTWEDKDKVVRDFIEDGKRPNLSFDDTYKILHDTLMG